MSKYKIKYISDEEWMYTMPNEMLDVCIAAMDNCGEPVGYTEEELKELKRKYPKYFE